MTALQIQAVAWTFLFIGIIIFVLGMLGLKDAEILKRRCSAKTEAKVLRYSYWGIDVTPYTIWVPIYEFIDGTGMTCAWESRTGRQHKKFKDGDIVTLCYDPLAPEDCCYIPAENPFRLIYITILIGSIVIAICMYALANAVVLATI